MAGENDDPTTKDGIVSSELAKKWANDYPFLGSGITQKSQFPKPTTRPTYKPVTEENNVE